MLKLFSFFAFTVYANGPAFKGPRPRVPDTDYIFRLENWNTGRVYVSEESDTLSFGLVCRGTGNEKITGEHGKRFANRICKELGFGRIANFVGDRRRYLEHMRLPYSTDSTKPSQPEYLIGGAKCRQCRKGCNRKESCTLRKYQNDTCIKGDSDVYIDCGQPDHLQTGTWSEWAQIETCDETDHFRQRSRKCKGILSAQCNGPWLEVIPCGLCEDLGKLTTEEPDYNSTYDYDSSSNISYSAYISSESTFRGPGPREPDTDQIWQSQLSTSGNAPQNRNQEKIVLSRRNGKIVCPKSIYANHFTKTRDSVNSKPVWQNNLDRSVVIWSDKIFNKGNKSGWVILKPHSTFYIAVWYSPTKTECPPKSMLRTTRGNKIVYQNVSIFYRWTLPSILFLCKLLAIIYCPENIFIFCQKSVLTNIHSK